MMSKITLRLRKAVCGFGCDTLDALSPLEDFNLTRRNREFCFLKHRFLIEGILGFSHDLAAFASSLSQRLNLLILIIPSSLYPSTLVVREKKKYLA